MVEDESAWQAHPASSSWPTSAWPSTWRHSYETALTLLRSGAHRLAVVDLSLDAADYQNQDGLRVLDALRRSDPGCVPILLTGFATVELAVSALNEHGAFTCLRKETFRRAQFRDVLRQALALAPVAAPLPAAGSLPEPPAVAPADTPSLPGRRLSRSLAVLHDAAPVAPPSADHGTAPGTSAGAVDGAAWAVADGPGAGPAGHTRPSGLARPASALVVEDDSGWRGILGELLSRGGLPGA